ncbi:MAG TPA: hypothetical protein VKS44_08100 [Candidatus Acidoferrales bacterium]|nr:hypothetical protein [Candidatus Acidoferrales bacterium]
MPPSASSLNLAVERADDGPPGEFAEKRFGHVAAPADGKGIGEGIGQLFGWEISP